MADRGWLDQVPLSIAHLCELDTPPAALIEAAATAGLASVGLRIHPAAPGGAFYPLATGSERAEVRRRIADTGVKVLFIELISITEATRAGDYAAMLETGAEIGATRLAIAGDSTDLDIVAERMGAICDLARPLGISVEIEFMPFRGVRTLAEAARVVAKAARPNAFVMVDALHVFRSGSTPDHVSRLEPRLIGSFQLCDAPAQAPPPAELVAEARTRRLFAGAGGLALWPLIDALPADTPVAVEVPLTPLFPGLSPPERLARMVRTTRAFLANRKTS